MSAPRGGIPITKNIRVTDTQGNEYEATYPKRAKGLVKTGRARFIDEGTICLLDARPSNHLEDEMDNMNFNNELLNRLDNIVSNTHHVNEAVKSIKEMAECGEVSEEVLANIFVSGVVDVVKSREATNQEAIALIREMHANSQHGQRLQ